MATPSTRVTGVLLLIDGLFVALLGFVGFLVFRPIAAIEGRPSPDQAPYPLLIVSLLLALAFAWAGQRAIRGIRAGRVVGMLLAAIPGLLFGAFLVTSPMSPGELAFAVVVVAVQVAIIVALARWPEPEVAGA
jgi:hypothetical protein